LNKRIFIQDHKSIPFAFNQNVDSFKVDEVFEKPFLNKGNYLILHVQKRDLTTLEMIAVLEGKTHCHNIGYAGLKDKYATTTQYISMPLKFSKELEKFSHPQIKILESFKHNEKISIGDLDANRFYIRLEKVSPNSAKEIDQMLETLMRYGMPNYFGYQRFSRDSDNLENCREIAHGEIDLKNKSKEKLLTSAYQSYLFNDWLIERVEFSKMVEKVDAKELAQKLNIDENDAQEIKDQSSLFKLLKGDILLDQQSKKWVNLTDLKSYKKAFKERKVTPTGLMSGKKSWRAKDVAYIFEEKYDDMLVQANGARREAWVYPTKVSSKYIPNEEAYELNFTLPKGAYATVLLENIANRNLG
jgi:tRNA pseudouridine13 synthase